LSYRETGVLTIEDLARKELLPSDERLRRGPVVILECPEEIPCNLCIYACPFKAISKDRIYSVPRVDFDKCIGCGACIPQCPGLAIFVVDLSRENYALISLPYEMLPKPEKDSIAVLLDREGREVGVGRIVKVWQYDKTWVVTVEVPRDKWWEVRNIRIQRK